MSIHLQHVVNQPEREARQSPHLQEYILPRVLCTFHLNQLLLIDMAPFIYWPLVQCITSHILDSVHPVQPICVTLCNTSHGSINKAWACFQMLPSVLSQVLYSRYSERNTWAFPLMPWQTPILFPTREFPNCAKEILMAFQTSRFCFTPGLLMARTYHLILPMVSGPNQWE